MPKFLARLFLLIPPILCAVDYAHYYHNDHWFSRSPMEMLIGVGINIVALLSVIAIELAPK